MNETLLNKARLNVVSLNKALINGAVERHGSSAGGGGVIIPPSEPDVPDVPVTYILSASASNGVVSASVNGKAVALPYTANDGDVVVVEVTANDGYQFEGWSDGSTDNPRSIIMTADVTLSATCVVKAVEKEYIQFASPAVEAICVANWSSDGIGLTMEDAAAVTSIAKVFKGNTEITSFNEFEMFTGVTSLMLEAFYGCTALKEITLPDNVTTIQEGNANYGAFRSCTALKKVIARGVTYVGCGAFYGCNSLEDLDIDWSKVTHIGTDIMNGCDTLFFDHLNLESLTSMNYNALKRVKVKKLSLGNLTTLPSSGSNYENYGDKSVLEEVVIPEGVTSIPNSSFYRYAVLSKVNIPNSVTSIGLSAYHECTSLESLYIPSGITSIGNSAFYKCTSLQTLDFPASVSSIGSSVCEGCTGLGSMVFRSIVPPTAGSIPFKSTTCPIYVPDAALEVYKTATNWSAYADRIHPLSELEGSPYITFADPEVERVLMENNVSSDGVGITMADAQAVTSIGTWFKGNTAIQSFDELQYFTGVTKLGVKYNYDGSSAAFSGCSNLASVVLPASIKVIGNSAFKGCSSLQNINIPSTITELDASAFEGCAFELNDLYLPNLTLFNIKVFHGGPKIRKISNLGSITSLPDAGWGANANYGDKSFLDEITLPATMTNIVQASFYNYIALHTVVCLAETPPSLANTNVFDGCPLNNGIYVPDASVDTYKAAGNWSTYASRIKPLSEYVES